MLMRANIEQQECIWSWNKTGLSLPNQFIYKISKAKMKKEFCKWLTTGYCRPSYHSTVHCHSRPPDKPSPSDTSHATVLNFMTPGHHFFWTRVFKILLWASSKLNADFAFPVWIYLDNFHCFICTHSHNHSRYFSPLPYIRFPCHTQ